MCVSQYNEINMHRGQWLFTKGSLQKYILSQSLSLGMELYLNEKYIHFISFHIKKSDNY